MEAVGLLERGCKTPTLAELSPKPTIDFRGLITIQPGPSASETTSIAFIRHRGDPWVSGGDQASTRGPQNCHGCSTRASPSGLQCSQVWPPGNQVIQLVGSGSDKWNVVPVRTDGENRGGVPSLPLLSGRRPSTVPERCRILSILVYRHPQGPLCTAFVVLLSRILSSHLPRVNLFLSFSLSSGMSHPYRRLPCHQTCIDHSASRIDSFI